MQNRRADNKLWTRVDHTIARARLMSASFQGVLLRRRYIDICLQELPPILLEGRHVRAGFAEPVSPIPERPKTPSAQPRQLDFETFAIPPVAFRRRRSMFRSLRRPLADQHVPWIVVIEECDFGQNLVRQIVQLLTGADWHEDMRYATSTAISTNVDALDGFDGTAEVQSTRRGPSPSNSLPRSAEQSANRGQRPRPAAGCGRSQLRRNEDNRVQLLALR